MKKTRKEKIHLVFDTNVLRSEPFYNRAEYDSLQTLVEYEHVEVHIPELVEREYTEQLKDEFSKHIDSIGSSSKDLSRSIAVSEHSLEKLNDVIKTIQRDGIKNIENSFIDKFYDELYANKLTIQNHHAPNVFNDYFSGAGTFKSKKERKDIPDAFILETIKDLNQQKTNLVVLVKDMQLDKACQSIGVATHDSLKSFLDSPDIQKTLEINSEKDFIGFISTGAGINTLINSFDSTALIDELVGKEIVSRLIPSDDNIATIMSVGDSSDFELEASSFTYLNKNKLSFPFSCEVEIGLSYFVYKGDYYAYDLSGSASDWNKHYFLVESEESVFVKGDLVVDFSMVDFSDTELDYEYAVEDVEISINAVDTIKLIEVVPQSKANSIKMICNRCKKTTKFDSSSLEWERTNRTARNMGNESCYSAEIDIECDCGNLMEARFNTWEYPEGVVSTTDSECSGCVVNETPVYQLNFV